MPFTPQENAEVSKVVQATNLLEQAGTIVANAVGAISTPLSTADTSKYSTALSYCNGQAGYLNLLLQELLFAYEVNTSSRSAGRATSLTRAWSKTDALVKSLNNGIANGLSKEPPLANAIPIVQQVIAVLQSIDRTLPYASPFPAAYPRILGPHGDYDSAQSVAALARKYADEAITSVTQFMTRPGNNAYWPVAANPDLGLMLMRSLQVAVRWTRVMAMTAGVVLPDDEAIIQADTAAGAGIRPEPFFRFLYSHELAITGDGGFNTFSGRSVGDGTPHFLNDILASTGRIFAAFLPVCPDDQLSKQLTGPANFMGDLGKTWRSTDSWSLLNLAFINAIPPLPVG